MGIKSLDELYQAESKILADEYRPDIIEFFTESKYLNMPFLSVPQRAQIKAIYGIPLTDEELYAFSLYCDTELKPDGYKEVFSICGARSGKSETVAGIAIYECLYGGHERYLHTGETGVFAVVAANTDQGQVIGNYAKGKIEQSPELRSALAKEPTLRDVEFKNRTAIKIRACTRVSSRSLSIIGAGLDEIAHWRYEADSATQDVEIYRSIVRGMPQFPDSKRFAISNPFIKEGLLYSRWVERASDPTVLVWRAPTWVMNSSLPRNESDIADAYDKDPEFAAREYGAEFVDAINTYLSPEAIRDCVVKDRKELEPSGEFLYKAAMDAAFRGDKFVFGIAHCNCEGMSVIDVLRSWQGSRLYPVQVREVAEEIKQLQAEYPFLEIWADQFAIEPLKQSFSEHGLRIEEKTFTPKFKGIIYSKLKAKSNSKRLELLDHPESLSELRGVEIRLTSGGGIQLGHAKRGGHDDYADVIAMLSEATDKVGTPMAVIAGQAKEQRQSPAARGSAMHERSWDRYRNRARGIR